MNLKSTSFGSIPFFLAVWTNMFLINILDSSTSFGLLGWNFWKWFSRASFDIFSLKESSLLRRTMTPFLLKLARVFRHSMTSPNVSKLSPRTKSSSFQSAAKKHATAYFELVQLSSQILQDSCKGWSSGRTSAGILQDNSLMARFICPRVTIFALDAL